MQGRNIELDFLDEHRLLLEHTPSRLVAADQLWLFVTATLRALQISEGFRQALESFMAACSAT